MPASLFIQYILFCMAGLFAVQLIRLGPRKHLGQILVYGAGALVLLVAIALDVHHPAALLLQGLLVLGPYALSIAYQIGIEKAIARGDLGRALKLAHSRARILPFRVHQEQALLYEGLVKAHAIARSEGRPAREVLSELAREEGLAALREYSLAAELSQLANDRDWEGILRIFEGDRKLEPSLQSVSAKLMLVRAYCELGELEIAIQTTQEVLKRKRWLKIRLQLLSSWLAILSSGGRREAVGLLLKQQLQAIPPVLATGWRARAAWAAGSPHEGKQLLEELRNDPQLPAQLRAPLIERIASMEGPPPPRGDKVEEELDGLERLLRLDILLFQGIRRSLDSRPLVGWGALTLLGTFTATWLLMDPDISRAQFGALSFLRASEPWRMLSALFLQEGWLALLVSVAVLLGLGHVLEAIFKSRLASVILLSTGLLGHLVGTYFKPDFLLVGAQSALLGCSGAMAAVLIRSRSFLPKSWRNALLRLTIQMSAMVLLLDALCSHTSVIGQLIACGFGFVEGMLLPMVGLLEIRMLPLQRGEAQVERPMHH